MYPLQRTLFAGLLMIPLVACRQEPPIAPSDTQVTPPAVETRTTSRATQWLAVVSAIAQASDNAGRREVIRQRLDVLGIAWRNSQFDVDVDTDTDTDSLQGENILARVSGPADAPLLLLGAHSDRVDTGRGATDNASGSAVVLALAERFRQRPLAHHRVAIALWDLEERGLLGAHAYVQDGSERPALYVNFDVFGWGDTVWMMTPDPAHPLVAATRTATQAAGLGLTAGEQYPPTDHRAFLDAGWPAVSYSLVDAGEVALILETYAGRPPATMPRVMQVIHTDRDTVVEIDANAAARGVDAIEAALRRWDAAGGALSAPQAPDKTAGTPDCFSARHS